ncbi:MAG: hypothetical protein IH945_12850 [Armatimonadetes bacterium]|nr:hypothetical protein [Armatimonadota bacterium]
MEQRMYSSSNVTKVIIYAAVIGGVIFLVNNFNTAKKEEVETVAAAIRETAAAITESGGQDPERIALAVAKMEEVSLGTVEKAIAKIDDGPAEFIAVELVLRRIFEPNRTAYLPSGIERERYTSKTYPWIFEGETARLEPFEVMSDPPEKVQFIFGTFSSQGSPRKPWR